MSRNASALGLEIPKRAVERIAGSPRGKQTLESGPIRPGFDQGAHGFDLPDHAFNRFAIAGVGHAFASSASTGLILDRRHDGNRLRLGTTCDHEFAQDRKMFNSYFKI